jgi:hypothetical protein
MTNFKDETIQKRRRIVRKLFKLADEKEGKASTANHMIAECCDVSLSSVHGWRRFGWPSSNTTSYHGPAGKLPAICELIDMMVQDKKAAAETKVELVHQRSLPIGQKVVSITAGRQDKIDENPVQSSPPPAPMKAEGHPVYIDSMPLILMAIRTMNSAQALHQIAYAAMCRVNEIQSGGD